MHILAFVSFSLRKIYHMYESTIIRLLQLRALYIKIIKASLFVRFVYSKTIGLLLYIALFDIDVKSFNVGNQN